MPLTALYIKPIRVNGFHGWIVVRFFTTLDGKKVVDYSAHGSYIKARKELLKVRLQVSSGQFDEIVDQWYRTDCNYLELYYPAARYPLLHRP